MNTQYHCKGQPQNILAFDVSGDQASVALYTCGKVHTILIPLGLGPHSYGARLLPTMQELLESQGIEFQDLDCIATSKGPGSFTGIRLGLATAQGLILATGAKSFCPTTFHIAAFKAWKEKVGSYLVTLTTKRNSFYTQEFDELLFPRGEASIQNEQEIKEFLAKNPSLQRVTNLSSSSAEDLIGLYVYGLESNAMISNGDISVQHTNVLSNGQSKVLQPYYLHNPEFVKTKKCSL